MISASGILTCVLVTLVATDLKPAKQISEIESTLKMQLIISTVLMTPVSHPAPGGWGGGPSGAAVGCACGWLLVGCCSCCQKQRQQAAAADNGCMPQEGTGSREIRSSVGRSVKHKPLSSPPLPNLAHTHPPTNQPQVTLAVAVTSLPPTFELAVPSHDQSKDFDTKVGAVQPQHIGTRGSPTTLLFCCLSCVCFRLSASLPPAKLDALSQLPPAHRTPQPHPQPLTNRNCCRAHTPTVPPPGRQELVPLRVRGVRPVGWPGHRPADGVLHLQPLQAGAGARGCSLCGGWAAGGRRRRRL